MRTHEIRELAALCGFELAGVTLAVPAHDFAHFRAWSDAGMAGAMRYLTDHRAEMRSDPRTLLPSARSIISVGKLYHAPGPSSLEIDDAEYGWIARYAWGEDYHAVLRQGLEKLAGLIEQRTGPFEWRAAVDTAPLLERALARESGLGWTGKNTCLINQQQGSWFFLGELLVSLELEPGAAPPGRCGTCTRCIDACPTGALTPYELDARLCISYLTIELRGPQPEELRAAIGHHVFGCDICQEVCPWNRRAPWTPPAALAPDLCAPPLDRLAALTSVEFRRLFGATPIVRARYSGFLRNVAIAMGNARLAQFRPALERLAASPEEAVRGAAQWALQQLP